MYADDVALIAESEEELQNMLHVLANWCTKWDVLINKDKSQILHHRQKSAIESKFTFKIDEHVLTIDYKLDYQVTAEAVPKSANRALGILTSRSKCL